MRVPLGYAQLTGLSAAQNLNNLTGAVGGATNASPIVITDVAHGLATGDEITIAGVGGNTAANGTWTITKIDADSFSLNSSTGNGTYTSGGTWFRQPKKTQFALVVAETQDVRWRDDGTDPSGTVGMLLEAKKPLVVTGVALRNFRVIETAASAKLNISFYKD